MAHELAKRRLGQQVGNYRLTRWLGQGGFADVYLGEHVYLKTQNAIKMLHVQLSEEMLQSFLHEAQIIATLDHPNIVRVFDYGIEGETPYLVMSYASNGSIRRLAPRGTRLQPERLLPMVQQIASALDYAHQHRLIHRDVKPENMLMGQHEEILLSDFGLVIVAQSSDSQTAHKLAGTVPYTAPEQLQGRVRFASDQYSLGIVAYEWICGERPFSGTFAEIASQHLLTPPPPLHQKVPGFSPLVEQVIFKAIAKDPAQRYESVTAFADALGDAYRKSGSLSMLVDISTEHPGSASRVTTPLDAPFVPGISQISTSPAPMTSGDPNQLSASFIPPSPPEPSQQSASLPQNRKLAVPLIVIMLLALIVGGGAWYSKFLSPAHGLGLRQSTSSVAGQATLTATTSGQTQATPGATPTGVANGNTPVSIAGTPGTSSTPGVSATPTTSGTPGASSTPTPPPVPGQTPTPVPDCLSGSASNLSFTSVLGLGNPAPQTMTLTNCGGNSGNWTASATTNGGGSWLSANPAGGTIAPNGNQNVQIQAASSGLQLGLYSGSITFHKGSATWTVTVSYTIVSV